MSSPICRRKTLPLSSGSKIKSIKPRRSDQQAQISWLLTWLMLRLWSSSQYAPSWVSTRLHGVLCKKNPSVLAGCEDRGPQHTSDPEEIYLNNKTWHQNSIFVSVNTTIQVKVIEKVIYINFINDMFRPLLGHHHVYLCVLRCWICVQYGSIFSSYLTVSLYDWLVVNLWFVYSSALSLIAMN
jgi:hypothetical protein